MSCVFGAHFKVAPAPKPALTDEQLLAVKKFADIHGRYWKDALRESWCTGGDHGALLQQVRNNLGPRWLTRFKLPKE